MPANRRAPSQFKSPRVSGGQDTRDWGRGKLAVLYDTINHHSRRLLRFGMRQMCCDDQNFYGEKYVADSTAYGDLLSNPGRGVNVSQAATRSRHSWEHARTGS